MIANLEFMFNATNESIIKSSLEISIAYKNQIQNMDFVDKM